MLTFYHSPNSRSTAILSVIKEMQLEDLIETRIVTIPRVDGSGGRDAGNPHPEGKVPALRHDGHLITERGAIIAHLCGLFPDSGLSPRPGTPEWGVFLAWLNWYQGVHETVLVLKAAEIAHPYLTAAIRGVDEAEARIRAALEQGPWLMGDNFSAVDVLVHSPYAWFRDFTPKDALFSDWVDRCMARPAAQAAVAQDARQMAA